MILAPTFLFDSRSDKIISDWLSLFAFPKLNRIFLPHKRNWLFLVKT